MIKHEIQFTAIKTAQIVERQLPELKADSVLVKTQYTVVSAGTERANLLDMPNTFAYGRFPKVEGYAGVGIVERTGENVKKVKIGDTVLVYHGTHADYSVVKERNVYPIPATVDAKQAVLCIIGAMGLGGLRKTALELGESAAVFGMGLLGLFACACARIGGAYPVIAVDLDENRRALAIEMGADYALDSNERGFAERVKELTRGGANAIVEVTGSAKAFSQALDCAARQARIALNGCTRVSDCSIDYYRQIHCPGITVIGAHNGVRPATDSYPHYWTNEADTLALVRLIEGGRLDVSPLIGEVVSTNDCASVYKRLCDDKEFPIGVLFDWQRKK